MTTKVYKVDSREKRIIARQTLIAAAQTQPGVGEIKNQLKTNRESVMIGARVMTRMLNKYCSMRGDTIVSTTLGNSLTNQHRSGNRWFCTRIYTCGRFSNCMRMPMGGFRTVCACSWATTAIGKVQVRQMPSPGCSCLDWTFV